MLRKSQKINQKELGEHLGITYTQISNYESGRSEVSLTTAIKIADYFNVDLESLVYKNLEEKGVTQPIKLTASERLAAFEEKESQLSESLKEAIKAAVAEEFEKYNKNKNS